MRVNIRKAGHKDRHVTIQDATQDNLLEWVKELISKQGLSIFEKGPVTTVEVRESIEGKNGRAKSFSFKGLDPAQVLTLITENIEK